MGEGGWERKSSRPWPPAGWPGASAEAWAATAADLNELRAWASSEDMASSDSVSSLTGTFRLKVPVRGGSHGTWELGHNVNRKTSVPGQATPPRRPLSGLRPGL